MASPQESNSQCLKRKLVDVCPSKDCKSRRIESGNGPSLDSSAKRCNCCCTRPNLASDCVNFLNSRVPNRIMYYKQGSWHNFPEQILKSLIEEFKGSKSSVVAVMDDEPVLVDFLSMTLVNLKTRKQRSVAWFDVTGQCFFPSQFFDEDSGELSKGDSGRIDNTAQGKLLDKVAKSPTEVVKQVPLESSSQVLQKPCTADILRKNITAVERGSEEFLFVQNLFLSGMGSFASPSSILHVHRYSPNDITAQCGLEAFERQMKSTKEERDDANVRYGWLGSRKNDIVKILINGLSTTAKPAEKASLSAGVYLSPENRAFTSVGLCDVDEKGVQYMLLCRVILGNVELVKPGSQESFPSSEMYDSGVDDCSNPKCYVMWPSHLSSHMRLEYLVSFKLMPKVQNYLLGLKGLWFHPSPKDVAVDISTLQPVMCETGEGPTTPWISFKVLFGAIQDNISSVARELLFHHYEELKESKITREEMAKKMIIIVGEKILLEALKKFHYRPSLWYKPSVEAQPGDPAGAIQEQLSMVETGNNCSLTLSVNHGASHAPNAMVEHMPVHSTKGCHSLLTEMVHCLAPSGGPRSSSAGAICRGSPSMQPKGTDCPKKFMSPGSSAAHCAKNLDSCAARVAPTIQDCLLRTISRKSAAPAGVVFNSGTPTTGPTGYASLSPSNASKIHGSSASGSTPKGCESVVPSLALGNPKRTASLPPSDASKTHGSSASGSTPKGRESVVQSLALGNPKCIASLPPSNASKTHGSSASGSTRKGCESVVPSLTLGNPKRIASLPPSNASKTHGSSASGSTPKGRESVVPSLALGNPKCTASLPPSNVSKTHGSSASGSTPKGCESVVTSLALGNSKSIGVKRLSSALRLAPEGKKFLSLGIPSQRLAVHSVKGQDSVTRVAIPSLHAPGSGSSRSISSEDHVSLALSITPKGHDDRASSKTLEHHESPRADKFPESGCSQAQNTVAKVYNAPTPITGEPKDQTGVHGLQNESSGPGHDASSHAVGAACALVALSTPRERGGR